ncbi:MAG: ANTAR domain-containing protein [Candidatus Saganbacteria bacterium]|nr:ANTAR domain-containing protein [Candidatus Saganbacteria bacterium]
MLTNRQREILELLKSKPLLTAEELREKFGFSRARLSQLLALLIKQKLVRREGRARATVYRLADRRIPEQVRRENWELRQKVAQLEKTLEDRKVIERAKELLAAQFDIGPAEAYRKLQERSMDSGRPLREVADRILSAFEI